MTDQKVTAFLDGIAQMSRRHGLCISHEDRHGAFAVVPFDAETLAWLTSAKPERTEPLVWAVDDNLRDLARLLAEE